MKRHRGWLVVAALCTAFLPGGRGEASPAAEDRDPVRVRPGMLASGIEQFAGAPVEVLEARAVGLFGTRVLVVDNAMRLPPIRGQRDRILVLVEDGEIGVDPALLVGATIRVTGIARTLLGVRVTREVPWPPELDRERLERLEIRAAVLAESVRTADGVELIAR